MCGIAGFSLSREFADKLDPDKLYALTETAVKCNLHRGKDAIGMFVAMPEIEQPHISYWKKPGPGDDHLDFAKTWIKELPLMPTSMGIHTRAKSSGFPETDNGNNHPVVYNDVIAIHNGMIRNHSAIKLNLKQYIRPNETYKTGMPPVDSLAIPMVLDSIANPLEEVEGIAERLALFEGGWAFHAAWADYPEIMLLVAGPEYPLQIRYSKGRLGYSSEPDAVENMFKDAELPWSKRNHVRELDAGSFMLVVNGEPHTFGQYDLKRKVYDAKIKALGGTGSAKYVRHVPTKDKVLDVSPDTSVTKGALNHDMLWSSTVVPDDLLVCIYTDDKGLIVDETTSPAFAALAPSLNNDKKYNPKDGEPWSSLIPGKASLEVLVEADTVFFAKVNSDKVLYGWFDQIELVCNEHGSIVGVYNWERSSAKRFTTELELKRQNEALLESKLQSYSPLLHSKKSNFHEWLRENSGDSSKGAIKGNVVGGVSYHSYEAWKAAKNDNEEDYYGVGFTFSGAKLSYMEKLEIAESFGFERDKWKGAIPVEFMYEALSHHIVSKDYVEYLEYFYDPKRDIVPFIYNDRCITHNSKLVTHDATSAYNCNTFLLCAALTIDTLDDIEAYQTLWEDQIGITIKYSNQPHAWGCKHKWSRSDSIDLELWGFAIHLAYEEQCGNCKSTRVIERYPDIITRLLEVSNEQEEAMEMDSLYAVDSSGGVVWSD